MKLSIVSTLYCSALYIGEYHGRASAVAKAFAGDDYEILLVNDGSPDESLDLAVALARDDPHVKVIDLSRNFGHHKAMMTGLAHSSGDLVFLIDSDLEEEPEWVYEFDQLLRHHQCDVVYGVQVRRKGGVFERWTGRWFYRGFKLLTRIDLPEDVVTARLMTRRYVEALVAHREREIFIAGLWHITGFDQRAKLVQKHSTSDTTYTFSKKLALLVESVTSFSNVPLVGVFYTGILLSLLASSYIAYLLFNRLVLASPLSGWTSVMASIWLLGGTIISFIGVLGMYLAKVYSETKQRPYTIVRLVHGGRSGDYS
ncbi:glycosyltransferase family 2 protein [Mycobacterium paragordonae]|uniref:glycosyltransferase family 2 protein n=1 Tax=Mycobacterium paragordonae TaxID=1389713 RepID=UPI0012E16891|nr:glycosyltransferase family 2 protein [Mycobacterium paragordonae]